jgi:4a-hydroxytetrahydrobiopterin dehydratase
MMTRPYSVSLIEMGWEIDGEGLTAKKLYRFKNFRSAFAFMTAMADEAERLCHHPDWRNVYGDVWVTLTTHDRGGLTHLDLALAKVCDQRFAQFIKE